jgi:hypothetical protein
MLNRSAVVVKAKQPFLNWVRSLPDRASVTLDEVNTDCTVYLVSELWPDDARDEIVALFCKHIFEDQLKRWRAEEQDWPATRDIVTFKKWFDAELYSTVHDLVDAPLEENDSDF